MQRRAYRRTKNAGSSYCVSCKKSYPYETFLIQAEESAWGKLVLLNEGTDVSMEGGDSELAEASVNKKSLSDRCQTCRSIEPCFVCARVLLGGKHPPRCEYCKSISRAYLESSLVLAALLSPTDVTDSLAYTVEADRATTVPAKRERSASSPSINDDQDDHVARRPIAALPLRGSSFTFRQDLDRNQEETDQPGPSGGQHRDESEETSGSGDEAGPGGILNAFIELVGLSPRANKKNPRLASSRNHDRSTPEPFTKRRKPDMGEVPTAPYSPRKLPGEESGDLADLETDTLPRPQTQRLPSTETGTPSRPQTQRPHSTKDNTADDNVQRDGDLSTRATSDDEPEQEEVSGGSPPPKNRRTLGEQERARHRAAQFRPEPLQRARTADESGTSPIRIRAPKVPLSFSDTDPLPNIPPSPTEEDPRRRPGEPEPLLEPQSTVSRTNGIISLGRAILGLSDRTEPGNRNAGPELQLDQGKRDSPGSRDLEATARGDRFSSSKPSGSRSRSLGSGSRTSWLENARSTDVIRKVPGYSNKDPQQPMRNRRSDKGLTDEEMDDEFSDDDMERGEIIASIMSAARQIDVLNGGTSSRSSGPKDKGKGRAIA